MKKTILAAALISALSTHAFAQATTTEGDTPAVSTTDAKNSTVLVEGENSFTEDQAKSRIADAGYTDVSALKLDDKGIWRATASKGGKSMSVGLDYQGNVAAQ
jgi:hypothetical protein